MQLSNAVLEMRGRASQSVEIPLSQSFPQNVEYILKFDLKLSRYSGELFSIVPDDCLRELRVNGRKVNLSGIQGLCDYSRGLRMDLSDYLSEDVNHIEARIWNGGGHSGLRFNMALEGMSSTHWKDWIVALLLLASVTALLRHLRIPGIAIFCILLGIAVRLVYMTYTSPTERSYDVEGQLEYVKWISENHSLPGTDACWSCYHPPLYYIGAGVLQTAAELRDASWSSRLLQQVHLLTSILTMSLGVGLLLRNLGRSGSFLMAAMLWVTWPGLVLASVRIGNDSVFYLGQVACLFFAQRWWEKRSSGDLWLATASACLALLAKSTGMVTLCGWFVLLCLGSLRVLRLPPWRHLLGQVLLVALTFFLAYSRMWMSWWEGSPLELVGNAHSLNSGLAVGNSLGNYIYFDWKDFLTQAYASPWNDNGGRQFFWNYALKTSLFGEFRLWANPLGELLAGVVSLSSLFVLLPMFWGMMNVRLKDIPLAVFSILLIAALIALRVKYPFSCSNDFRYIFPILVPAVYWAVQGVADCRHIRVKVLFYAGMALFVLSSLLILVLPAFS